MTPNGPRRRRLLAAVRRHPWRAAGLTLLAGFLVLNALAYRHARAMLTYQAAPDRTPPPQALSVGQKVRVLLSGVTVPRPANTRTPQELGLPGETVGLPTADGLSLEGWLLVPPKPCGTVLLFHGYAASRSSLLEQGRAVYETGFAALLVDFRGGGGSDGNTTSLGYHEAEDVAAAVRYARGRGLPAPLVLYGQSMGGAAVLRGVAALGVRPDGVILESVFDRMLGTVRNRFAVMGVPSFPAAELLVFWGGVQVGFSGFAHNPAEYARACGCPALVLHGADDRNATLRDGQAVCDGLLGPKELVVFAGAGHTSLHGADRDRWRAAVGRFLAGRVDDRPQAGP